MGLDKRLKATRRRVLRSPEYQWRLLVFRNSLTKEPSSPPFKDREVTTSSAKRAVNRLADVGPLMRARVALVASAEFHPCRYPGIRAEIAQSANDGWIAWFIMPELRTVLDYAIHLKDVRVESVRASVNRVSIQAKNYITNQLNDARDLTFDDRVICETLITNVLEVKGTGTPQYALQEVTEPDRARVNEILGVDSPWVIAPLGESVAEQMIRQLRDRGHTDEEILSLIEANDLGNDRGVSELRSKVKTSKALSPETRNPPKVDSEEVEKVDTESKSVTDEDEGINRDAIPKGPRTLEFRKTNPIAKQAWKLTFFEGMTQKEIARKLSIEYKRQISQGQVSKWIKAEKAEADASGLSDLLPPKAKPPKIMDPGRLELGKRVDPRRPRPSDTERADDLDD